MNQVLERESELNKYSREGKSNFESNEGINSISVIKNSLKDEEITHI